MDNTTFNEFISDIRARASQLYERSSKTSTRATEANELLGAIYWQQVAQTHTLLAIKEKLEK